MTSLRKSLISQLVSPVLDVTASAQVIFVGGYTREIIHTFPTMQEAGRAYIEAKRAVDRLAEIARSTRV